MRNADTIFATASGTGKTAVKVVRISGKSASEIARRFGLGSLPARAACLRKIRHPQNPDEVLDTGLAIWFPGPHSFTGEDCLELQIHGGRAVEHALHRALSQHPECRMAEPGEFAWRAFSNGKMDLTAVEGLADLIDAQTELQRRQAVRQSQGHLFEYAMRWRVALLDCLALIEADIDFEDESDAPKRTTGRVATLAHGISDDFQAALATFSRAEVVREGFIVMLMGPPNAGKSSLFNYLLKRDAAIVSSTPGTTRDLLEAVLDLDGAPIVFIDTAGLQETKDPVERIGIEKAREKAKKAQLVLWLSDCSVEEGNAEKDLPSCEMIYVRTKSDLAKADLVPQRGFSHAISTVTGEGIGELLELISKTALAQLDSIEPSILTRERHYSAVHSAAEALARIPVVEECPELVAEELRYAARCVEELTGRIDSEDILGDIFSRFCIGK